VKLRSLAAAALVFLSVPITARAQETPAEWIAPAYRPEILPPRVLAEAREVKIEASLTQTPTPLLSKAAKITIIVCAIVVGVIIIVGVVSIRPH
jgi:hypothetical protein